MTASTDDLSAALQDMAGRRYMNAIDCRRDREVEQAVYEAGAAHGLLQFQHMVMYYSEEGDWPADTPDEAYVAVAEVAGEEPSADRGSSKPGVY